MDQSRSWLGSSPRCMQRWTLVSWLACKTTDSSWSSCKSAHVDHLPPIAKIAAYTSAQLLDALIYLRLLYNPEVRGSRRIRAGQPTKSHLSDDSDAVQPSHSIRHLREFLCDPMAHYADIPDGGHPGINSRHVSHRYLNPASCCAAGYMRRCHRSCRHCAAHLLFRV